MIEIQCELEQFEGRIIFMSVYNDIVWREKGHEELCIVNSKIVGRFLALGQGRNGTELTRTNQMGDGVVSLRT